MANYSYAPDYSTQDPLESAAISVVDGLFMAANDIRQVPVKDIVTDGSGKLELVMLNGTLRQCIEHIGRDIKPGERLENLYIGCHGDLLGQLAIECYPGQGGKPALSSYETIAAAANDPATTLVIPGRLLATAADGRVLTRVILFACIVGRYEPVMRKLKEAFGGTVTLISAKHIMALNTIGPWSTGHPEGTYLLLQYVFTVSRPEQLKNRKAILKAFADREDLKLVDGSRVPPELWKLAIPEGKTKEHKLTYRLAQAPGGGGTLPQDKAFTFRSYSVQDVPFERTIPFADPRPPAKRGSPKIDPKVAIPIFRAHLAQLPELAESHPFPVFRRHGFGSLDELIGGFKWTFTAAGSQLACKGNRTEYRVSFPITSFPMTEPGPSGRPSLNGAPVLFNFYPAGQPFGAQPELLRYDDPLYFRTI